jgi:DNA-binding transcriptional ArsR family regulator
LTTNIVEIYDPAMPQPAVEIVRESRRARVLLDPKRRRLVAALAGGPDSATGLARRLDDTRQRINYHLRQLEQAGIVELAEERRKGSQPERIMRLVARRYVIDPGAGEGPAPDPDAVGDRFSAAYLVALTTRALRELADLLDRAKTRRARLATASVNTSIRLASPAAFDAFTRDLTDAIGAVVSRHHTEGGDGRWFRVLAGAYPGPRPTRLPEREQS